MAAGKQQIILGITGSISAYKSCEIIRLLKKQGYETTCIMTESATKFITPLTLQTLSGHPVQTDLFQTPDKWNVRHISLADQSDLVLIAPATANIIGKIAAGIADDFLTTLVLAVRVPVVLAPAMDEGMFTNPIVQENIRKLKKRGYIFLKPEEGDLASGKKGVGRLPEPSLIVREVLDVLNKKKSLLGKTVLVTAGPTREYWDSIRFISNPSSGKMGYALAEESARRGARTVLITGPVDLKVPDRVIPVRIQSALQMQKEVRQYLSQSDIFFSCAAVSDWRPAVVFPQKLKKDQKQFSLSLIANPDILQESGQNKKNKIFIGFSLETENLISNARQKLRQKNLDFIVANYARDSISREKTSVVILTREGRTVRLPNLTKTEVAGKLFDLVEHKLG